MVSSCALTLLCAPLAAAGPVKGGARVRRAPAGPATAGGAESPGQPSAGGESGEERGGEGVPLPVAAAGCQGRPAVRGPLAQLAAEHDDPDEQQPPVQPAAQPLADFRLPRPAGLLPVSAVRAAGARAGIASRAARPRVPSPRDPRRRHEGGPGDEHRFPRELRRRSDGKRRAGRADARAGRRPDGPGGVHRRHQRASGRLLDGGSLSADEAECAFGQVLEGTASPAQTAALVVALRAKGESVEEMTGLVRAMLAHAEPLVIEGDLVDVVGTGGDRLRSINVSTLAALIAAGAGARVCKHGNRAQSSSVGTADVLEALGVVVDLGPVGVARCVTEVGMGFCFAPRYHPAMRFAGPVRKELGVPTVFNFLGPLANPARARYQLVGVSDPGMASLMAQVLATNGSRRAMVVYADDGLDELSVTSPATVLEVVAGAGDHEVRPWRLDPASLGFPPATMQDLRGGDAAFNAAVIRNVLEGERSPRRDIGVLNAAAALVVAGRATGIDEGIAAAADSIESGRAGEVLEGLARVSTAAAEEARRAARSAVGPTVTIGPED